MAEHSIGTPGRSGAQAMMTVDLASERAGLTVTEFGEGTATVTMTVREDHVNGHAITHGGYVFLLADTAFACACNSEGSVTVAAGADITFLAATRLGDQLVARASRRSQVGRSGIYDVTVTKLAGGLETPVAEFRGRSRTLTAPATRGVDSAPDEHEDPPRTEGTVGR